MNRNKLGLTWAALCMLILILDSRAAADAATAGVEACIRTVIPALFPFFLLSGYITGFLSTGKLSGLIARIFHSPGNCGGILLAGLLGGYPLGAKLASEECQNGHISKSQADRLLMFCSQAGPSFLFGIAAAQLNTAASGWLLWGIQLLSAWTVAQLFPIQEAGVPIHDRRGQSTWNEAMRLSVKSMAFVCGWVVIFSVVIRFISRCVLWLLPVPLQILICGMLELTNGCLMLSSVSDPKQRFLLAAVMLNFGGVCVAMQTASVAPDLNFRRYLLGKTMQTLISILIALAIMVNFVFAVPLVIVFFIKSSGIFRKKSSNLIKVGV